MTGYDPTKHHRRSIRLRGYDYTQAGAYFVTLVTHERACLFGEVVAESGEMRLNELGRVVRDEWERSADLRREIELDAFVAMPNHIHGIVIITNPVGATGRSPLRHDPPSAPDDRSLAKPGPAKRSLGAFVAGFKSAVTKRLNDIRNTPGQPVWQRNYYEHIIRNEADLDRIRQYITENPWRWALDGENPARER